MTNEIESYPLAGVKEAVAKMLAAREPVTPEQEAEWIWRNEVIPEIEASRLPLSYRKLRTEWNCPEQKAVFDLCRALTRRGEDRKGAIIALVGPRGVGKTEIAAQLIIERAMRANALPWHRRPPYRKLTDLIAKWKPIYSDFGSRDAESLLASRDWFCTHAPFAVIDEIHDCDDQRVKDRLLTDVLDRRYSNGNDTVLISNQTFKDFVENTNPSIVSRLKEAGKVIECRWKSWR